MIDPEKFFASPRVLTAVGENIIVRWIKPPDYIESESGLALPQNKGVETDQTLYGEVEDVGATEMPVVVNGVRRILQEGDVVTWSMYTGIGLNLGDGKERVRLVPDEIIGLVFTPESSQQRTIYEIEGVEPGEAE